MILYSEDLEGSVEAVTAAGGTIAEPIYPFPGGRRFHFADPAGNELAVWSDRSPRLLQPRSPASRIHAGAGLCLPWRPCSPG